MMFDNAVCKLYDVHRLTDREAFEPLRNRHFFSSVSVEPGGYAVSWGPDIDISEHELWVNGEKLCASPYTDDETGIPLTSGSNTQD